jgi:hypothetical protein
MESIPSNDASLVDKNPVLDIDVSSGLSDW